VCAICGKTDLARACSNEPHTESAEQVALLHLTRPFPHVAVGKGSGHARLSLTYHYTILSNLSIDKSKYYVTHSEETVLLQKLFKCVKSS